jgi:hypothetical protein
MRCALSGSISGFLPVLLTAILSFAPSGVIQAQSATRSFQMGMWVFPNTPIPTTADADIRTFYEGQDQPLGRSVMLLDWTSPVSASGYDWSRIVAVVIDEPYTSVDGNLDPDCSFAPSPKLLAAITPIDAKLVQRAAELKSFAPLTRFWVNFTAAEGGWMGRCANPQVFNRSYVDVISQDHYYVGFDGVVSSFYAALAANPAKPDQQLALIPGAFYRSGHDSPSTQASYLQGYFAYANNVNQACNLPLGSRGATGIGDGCPVWIVMGFVSGTFTDGDTTYVGELDSRSAEIAGVWRAEVALPLAPKLAHQPTRGQMLSTILPLLLDH